MDTFFAALDHVLSLQVLIALLIGSVGGVIIGAIPGVGPAVAIAILLPATFSLEPIVGLTLLLGVYGSSMYGGALPAILINTPGTAVNAMTTYDGYPMTKRGEAGRALSLAYSASFFGGVFAVIVLILLAPVLAAVAPMFGSREIFLAALFGLVLVVVTHRGKHLVSLLLVCFGIFINTIGLEPVRYSKRYTFDQEWLSSGVNLIVVVLGLFALSQAFLLLLERDGAPKPPSVKTSMFGGLKEVTRHPKVASSSSFFGVLMGIIPGVGEFLAQFFAYSFAMKTSKKPEEFGKGNPEGLIACEAANNAVPPAAMIPLLALGIPGEALTAMMLTVFHVHNVIPGPQLFQDKPDFVVALYISLLMLNILVIVFLGLAGKTLLKIVQVPTRFIGVLVLTLSFVGVYSLRNSAIDCLLAAVFGLIGLILRRLDWPIVPIILGMVLGGIMEAKLRTSLPRLKDPLDLVDRPISAVLFTLIVLAIVLHFWTLYRARQQKRSAG